MDSDKFLDLVKSKKVTVTLAPSFPVDFEENQIVGGLKKLGVKHVVDHSLGIATVNKMYEENLRKYSNKLYIAANCPSTCYLIKNKFPGLEKYLMPVFSPMACMAKICKKTWPDNVIVFVGPCVTKKQEARNYPEIEMALTFKEIGEVFEKTNIDLSSYVDTKIGVEGFEEEILKIFSTRGGIKKTIRGGLLKDEEVIIADGVNSLEKIFAKIEKSGLEKKVRLLDVLFCKGGCIGGPGINSKDKISSRQQRLLEYLSKGRLKPFCSEVDVA